jgi:hypothetical protein
MSKNFIRIPDRFPFVPQAEEPNFHDPIRSVNYQTSQLNRSAFLSHNQAIMNPFLFPGLSQSLVRVVTVSFNRAAKVIPYFLFANTRMKIVEINSESSLKEVLSSVAIQGRIDIKTYPIGQNTPF